MNELFNLFHCQNPKDGDAVVCIVLAWLGFCFEFWVNASEDLV